MRTFVGRALRGATILSVAAIVLAAVAPERSALAHAVGVSSGEYRLDGNVVYGDLGMADRELARLLPAIDTNHDGSIDAEELAAGREAVVRAVAAGVTVQADGKACAGSVDRAWVSEEDNGAVFQVRYTCAAAPARLTLAMPMLDGLAPGTATWPASSARANPRWLSSIGPTPPGRWAARARRPAPAGSPGRC